MRTLAIGDIHGCLKSLERLVADVEPQASDRLVLLGDYVDRGPDSRGVLDWILSARRSLEVIPLRGNHELMMLESRDNPVMARSWAAFGGRQTLDSYGTRSFQNWVKAVPAEHWEFLEQTALYYETGEYLFVHGSVAADLPLAKQDPRELLWERCYEMKPHHSGRRVICGHTPQGGGEIGRYEWGVCLDTGCCRGGWLTCLDVATGRFWQANEEGDAQGGQLDSL